MRYLNQAFGGQADVISFSHAGHAPNVDTDGTHSEMLVYGALVLPARACRHSQAGSVLGRGLRLHLRFLAL